MMYESNMFRFAQLMDSEFLERIKLRPILALTPEEIEKAEGIRFEAFDLVDTKTANLYALSRNMGDTTETDAPAASDEDRMNVWFMVSKELKDIEELQGLIRDLDYHLFDAYQRGRDDT